LHQDWAVAAVDTPRNGREQDRVPDPRDATVSGGPQPGPAAPAPRSAADDGPRRGEVTFTGAHVLSMDPEIGEIDGGDVHIRDGAVHAVGRGLPGGGRRIDARGCVVMPGLIDTHWHLWNTLYRSLAGADAGSGYFALNLRLGAAMRPDDLFLGGRLALAEALSGGITTVHDWSHNIRGPAYADACLRALTEAGVRARFSYGPPQGHPPGRTLELEDLARVAAQHSTDLVHIGLAGRPPGLVAEAVYREEFAAAQDLQIPVTFHAHATRRHQAMDQIAALDAAGMLGPRTQLVHALYTSEADRRILAESRTPVSVSPWTELMIGYGFFPVNLMVADGVALSLSVDTTALSGTADMFSIMRLMINLAHGQAEAEFGLDARKVLRWATIDAAQGLGLDAVTGSLTPGKRADVIMVRADQPNIAPLTHAPHAVVLAAHPGNVDTVVVDGRIVKQAGRLTAVDTERVAAEAAEALRALLARAD
jgi:5-methylthioadenosine/S-adenosylhomocysteine deaminase